MPAPRRGGKEEWVKYGDKITTRLRPDVDRRLRTFALLRGARITHVINDALDQALPRMDDIAAMVAQTVAAAAGEEVTDGGPR